MALSPENAKLIEKTFGSLVLDPNLAGDGMVRISEAGLNTLLDAARAEGTSEPLDAQRMLAMVVESAGGSVSVSPAIAQVAPDLMLHRHDDRDGSICWATTKPRARSPQELQDRMPT